MFDSHELKYYQFQHGLGGQKKQGKNKVTLVWVLTHIGVKRNELIDNLAKKLPKISFVGSEPFCGVKLFWEY